MMMQGLFGLAMVAASVGLFLYFRPTEERPSRLTGVPYFEALIPLAVVCGIAIGGAIGFSLLGL